MKEWIAPNDRYQMNWVAGETEWGTVRAPEGIKVTRKTHRGDGIIKERYVFTNIGTKELMTARNDIAIYTPFHDDYTDSAVCMRERCHTHIWCGEQISYVMALRMGGEAPHLGMVLTEGSLSGYSVERDLEKISNDRGDFLMHPSPVSLAPQESFAIGWTLFWHEGAEDFYEKLKQYHPNDIRVQAENYIVFQGEWISIKIKPAFDFSEDEVHIMRNGEPVAFEVKDGVISVREKGAGCSASNTAGCSASNTKNGGEQKYSIQIKGIQTHCNILVLPPLLALAGRRCRFIAEKQQYHHAGSGLDGAYLVYDNEEQHIYYHPTPDYNGGRERVGMGILLARYLQSHKDQRLSDSLEAYIAYVERELFDRESGVVYNDYQRDNSWNRLYNYPWMSVFYLELYRLYAKREHLRASYLALKSFYAQGGGAFYAIAIPLREIVEALADAHMSSEREELLTHFAEHCAYIMEHGLDYPAHEVNYEQSIVAPAASLLLQMYAVTKEEKYLTAAERQIGVLELFSGLQPDYHLYEVAIRHWDGYWFGKKKMFGDTFPHYWSALTAVVYEDYAALTGNEKYRKAADAAYRGVLSLFMPDGSASCAYVYPVSVNGSACGYYDPYANDQDWGLYFMLRHVDHLRNARKA